MNYFKYGALGVVAVFVLQATFLFAGALLGCDNYYEVGCKSGIGNFFGAIGTVLTLPALVAAILMMGFMWVGVPILLIVLLVKYFLNRRVQKTMDTIQVHAQETREDVFRAAGQNDGVVAEKADPKQ